MPPGPWTRPTSCRTAVSLVILGSAIASTGCRQVSMPRPDLSPAPPEIGSEARPPEPASLAGARPRLVPVSESPAAEPIAPLPPPTIVPPPPTPLLDAAIARADAQREAILSEVRRPNVEPPIALPKAVAVSVAEPIRPVGQAPVFEPAPPLGPIAGPESGPVMIGYTRPPDPLPEPPAVLAEPPHGTIEGLPEVPPIDEMVAPVVVAVDPGPLPDDVEVVAEEASPPLSIANLRFCAKVHGFGHFEPLGRADFRAGQTVLVYCEIVGLRYRPEGETYRSRLSSTAELLEPGRDEPIWRQALGEADDVLHRPRRDYFVNYLVHLPSPLRPGAYRLRIVQTDALADRTTSDEIAVTIRP